MRGWVLLSLYNQKAKLSADHQSVAKHLDRKFVFAKMNSSPNEISAFIRAVIKSNPTHFANLLTSTDSNKSTLLHLIVHRVPALLLDIIALAKTNKSIAIALSNALAWQNTAKWTPFDKIVTASPELLPALFEFAKVNSELQSGLAKALEARDSFNWTGFHMLVRYAPQYLLQFFALTHNEQIRRSVALALVTKNNKQSTGFCLIEDYCSSAIRNKLIHHLIDMANWLRKNLADSEWELFLQSPFAEYVADTIAPEDYEKYVDRKIDFIAVGLSRSQTQILQQLAIYLRKINNPDALLLADAIENNGGLCQGFAICDSVMHSLGKAAWWDEIKRLVAEENQDDRTIMPKAYHLPDGEQDLALAVIFELALNFIVFNYARVIGKNTFGFISDKLVQDDFLKPATSNHTSLEVLVGTQVKKVKSHDKHAGYFAKDELIAFLNQNKAVIQRSICVMGPLGHGCSLTVDGNYWYFRDCNRNNGAPHKVNSENTAELAAIMHKKIGNNLYLHIASFDEADIKFNRASVSFLVNGRIQKNLNKKSLILLLEKSSTAEVIVFFQQIKLNSLFRKQLADLLIEKNVVKVTVLCSIMFWHGEDALRELMECVKLDEYFFARFSAAFVVPFSNGATILHVLAINSPVQLLSLIELIKPNKGLYACFATALNLQDRDQWTALHYIAEFAPNALPALIELAKTDDTLRTSFLNAFFVEDTSGEMVLDKLKENMLTRLLPTLFELVKTTPELQCSLARGLSAVKYQKYVNLITFFKFKPQQEYKPQPILSSSLTIK